MSIQEYVNDKVKTIAPINGVSFGSLTDTATWRIDYKAEATQAERDAGYAYIDSLDAAQLLADDTSSQALEKSRAESMLEGVEFEGVMCSALKEDQWGLSSVRAYVIAGSTIPFKFVNQNTIILNSENLAGFEAVWVPFRASFFTV